MRYALSTSPQRTTWSWLADVWDRADDHEVFESAWTFDHFYPLFGDSSEDCLEGWVTLTALLARTRRVRGGVLVSGMVYRHPGLLANMAATLDHTSRGRLELGVGAGWNEEECSAYGLELGSMRERFDRFAEGLEVIESLLTQERTTFQGRWYQLNDAMCWPKPVQPRLPLCMGGRGRRAQCHWPGVSHNTGITRVPIRPSSPTFAVFWPNMRRCMVEMLPTSPVVPSCVMPAMRRRCDTMWRRSPRWGWT
jgi:alkanesulfonate monooxygenase SsuD/methylene tetrahydromethanopterin reductase-like flavin-dependent oxidoreductase (luciferase family)